MQILSQFLLTSCLLPIPDTAPTPLASWGALEPLSPSPATATAAPLVCDGLQGLRVASNGPASSVAVAGGPLLQSARSLPMDGAADDPAAPVAWAVELWVLPTEPTSDQRPMLTIGEPSRLPTRDPDVDGGDDDENDDRSNDDYCRGLNLELLTYRGHFLVRFRSEEAACNTVYLSSVPLIPESLTQLVIAFERQPNRTNALSIFVDGQAVHRNVALGAVTVSGTSNASVVRSWNPGSVLWLFGNPSRPRPFGGGLAQVSFHGALNGGDAAKGSKATLEQWVEGLFERGVMRDRPLPLEAVPAESVRIDQADTTPLLMAVRSRPNATPSFRVSMELLNVPTHGRLIWPGQDQEGKVADVWPFPSDANETDQGLLIAYRLNSADYFNLPSVNAYGKDLPLKPESFQYRLIAYDSSGRELAVSPVVTQVISVVHVNHPPHLKGPTSVDPKYIHGGTAIVKGIVLEDADRDFNIDRVRVDVWSSMGYLTLSPHDRSRADFQSCRGRTDSSWQCTGNATRSRSMTFIAIPDDVGRILDRLKYEAILAGQDDRIVVRVWDGQGEECLSLKEHLHHQEGFVETVTSQRGCFDTTLTIHVPILRFNSDPNSLRHGGFQGTRVNVARLLFWVLVLMLTMCCCCCLRRLPRCLARGAKVEVDEEEGSQSVASRATITMDGHSV